MRSLPKDIKEKISEKDLSFSDFPDLRKILSVNWRQLESHSSYKKDHVLNHLEGLEPIRNDIAHSRDISPGALSMIDAAFFVVSAFMQLPDTQSLLPKTSHQEVAMARIKAAIKHNGAIGQSDVEAIRDGSTELAEIIEKFQRLKSRPGRPVTLLTDARSAAVNMIEQIEKERTSA